MTCSPRHISLIICLLVCLTLACSHPKSAKAPVPQDAPAPTAAASSNPWNFVVAGDSRNCGDLIMPSIADGARSHDAQFYWHLGDLRKISGPDQDFMQLAAIMNRHPDLKTYQTAAWKDFIANQILPFGPIPFFVGIGNHETIPPKTREQFVAQFEQWLNPPVIKAQRLKDDPNDQQIKTYYHWQRDGIDFIYLDNADWEQFSDAQLAWFEGVLARDRSDASIRTLVVGMHAALPWSISANHSMNEWPLGEASGKRVYQDLLNLQNGSHRLVYVLASHSHFVMENAFNTEYWRTHGGVLNGWIIGTAGAERYRLPPNYQSAKFAKTDVYGYLLATVNPPGQPSGTIQFAFQEIDEKQIPEERVDRFLQKFVDDCFNGNRRLDPFPEPERTPAQP
jgi:hypothetical protein